MPDYKEMYFGLFRDVTKAVTILQDAQRKTEDMYIESEDTVLHILPPKDEHPEEDT